MSPSPPSRRQPPRPATRAASATAHDSPRRGVRPAAGRPRTTVSPERYRLRRAVAVIIAAVVVAGLVRLGSGWRDGDGDVAVAETLGPSTSTAAATSAPATTEPPAPSSSVKVPTAETKANLLIAGDSDAGTFGPYLKKLLDQTKIVATTLDYKVSSGLSRPDFFDWPAQLRRKVPEVAADIVVVTFGGNDAQDLLIDGRSTPVDSEPWRAEYGRRVGEVMDYLRGEGRTLVWVGIPNDDDPKFTARLAVQDEVVRSQAASRPDVHFIDTWNRFSGIDGSWAKYVVDPRDGQGKDVRASDGFHLNVTGAEILALDIFEAVKADLLARGAEI